MNDEDNQLLNSNVTMGEINKALNKSKNNKAVEIDNISNELFEK